MVTAVFRWAARAGRSRHGGLFAIALLAATAACSEVAAARRVEIEDVITAARAPSLSELRFTRDGREVILAWRRPGAAPLLEVVRLDTGASRRLAEGSRPTVVGFGDWVYFIGPRGDLRRASSVGGQEEVLPLADGVQLDGGYALSADGRYAYIARQAATQAAPAPAGATVTVVRSGRGAPTTDILELDLEQGRTRVLASVEGGVTSLLTVEQGRALVLGTGWVDFSAKDPLLPGRLLRLDLLSGAVKALSPPLDPNGVTPVLRPGGRELAFRHNRLVTSFPVFPDLAILEDGRYRRATEDLFVGHVAWGPNRSIYVTAKGRQDPISQQVYQISAGGVVRKQSSGLGRIPALAASADGKIVAYARLDPYGGLALIAIERGRERIVRMLRSPPEGLTLGTVQQVNYAASDGQPLAGLVVRPSNFDGAKRYPAIVELHGGPSGGIHFEGQVLAATPLEWHYWAGRGYVVFVPEYRGSATWGYDGVERWRRDRNPYAADAQDVADGVDHLVRAGIADPARLGLIGFSHGSALTSWIVTHDHRYAVGAALEGWAEDYAGYGAGFRLGGNPGLAWTYGGPPWSHPKGYLENSAIISVKGVRTPMLFMNGSDGVPAYSQEFLFTAWLRQGVPAQYLRYGGEGHVILQEPNRRDLLERVSAWLDEVLRPATGRPSGNEARR